MKTKGALTSLGLALLGVLVAGVSALAEDSSQGQSPLDPAGPAAQHISDLWYIVLIPAMIVLLGVGGALVFVALRYREKDPDFVPKQVGGNNALEFTWTLIPSMILLGIFVLTVFQMPFLRRSPSDAALTIQVTGQQWAWSFQYLDGSSKPVSTFGTVYIPAGKVVNLNVESRDVIHSWSVPRLSGKIDAIPGKHNTSWIEADIPGTYYGQCTEFCGLSHAQMTVKVIALPEDQFNAWYTKQKQQLGG